MKLKHVSLAIGLLASIAFPLRAAFSPEKVDSLVEAQMKAKKFMGISVAVVEDGKIVMAKAYGLRTNSPDAKAREDTPFAIGSVTKQFTCAAILLLAEDGRLSVSDPVAKYYPALTKADQITIRDLMNHVSGYTDYYPLDFVDARMQKPIAPDDLIAQYAGMKLDFEPGTRYSYSNTGFTLLGRIVEKASGMSLGEFLKKRIFTPLEMSHTYFEPGSGNGEFASGFRAFALGPLDPAAPEGAGWLNGAGGMWSTPSDLAKWDIALMEGKLLSQASFTLMTTGRELKSGRNTEYGCGVQILRRHGRVIITHSGAVSGFMAQNAFVSSTHEAVILLSNCEEPLAMLHTQLLDMLLEEAQPDVPKVNGITAKEAAMRIFLQLQSGSPIRTELGKDYSDFLTEEKVRATSERLKPLGRISKAEVLTTRERGGMEVTRTRLTLKSQTLSGLMYRTPDGLIQEFLINVE